MAGACIVPRGKLALHSQENTVIHTAIQTLPNNPPCGYSFHQLTHTHPKINSQYYPLNERSCLPKNHLTILRYCPFKEWSCLPKNQFTILALYYYFFWEVVLTKKSTHDTIPLMKMKIISQYCRAYKKTHETVPFRRVCAYQKSAHNTVCPFKESSCLPKIN